METQDLIDFCWSLIQQESGTAITWILIGVGAGLLFSILLIGFLWIFLKNRNFLGGKTGARWPKYLLLACWIFILPLSCMTSGGAWGLVTATHKIATNQKAIEEAVSLSVEKPLNDSFINLIENSEVPAKQKALLLQQQGDEIRVSTLELDKWLIQAEHTLYDFIKTQALTFLESNHENSLSLPQGIERWLIDSILAEHSPATFSKEGRAAIKHVEETFGTQVTAKELGHSLGAVIVKPHIDKAVKDIKSSIIITSLIQLAATVLISIGIAALLVLMVRKAQKNRSTDTSS